MKTPKKNQPKMTHDEKLRLRNSPALFEFYRSLTALHVVLVRYVQSDENLKEVKADEEVEAYSAKATELEERAADATRACQKLIRKFGGGCPPPSTWDEATETCG